MNKDIWKTLHDADLFQIQRNGESKLIFNVRLSLISKMFGGGPDDTISIALNDVQHAKIQYYSQKPEVDLLDDPQDRDTDYEIMGAKLSEHGLNVTLRDGVIDLKYDSEIVTLNGMPIDLLALWKKQ